MLDDFLALNRIADVIELFVVHKSLQSISLAEATDSPFSMFEGAARQVLVTPA